MTLQCNEKIRNWRSLNHVQHGTYGDHLPNPLDCRFIVLELLYGYSIPEETPNKISALLSKDCEEFPVVIVVEEKTKPLTLGRMATNSESEV